MSKIPVFIDSDVIISSLISSTGAASLLCKELEIDRYISNRSNKELSIVVERLGIQKDRLEELITDNCKMIEITESKKIIVTQFGKYTFDLDDCHIVAGAKKSKAKFLTTYNIRHFKIDKIKDDLGIIVLRPAQLLQYLRSRE